MLLLCKELLLPEANQGNCYGRVGEGGGYSMSLPGAIVLRSGLAMLLIDLVKL